MDQIADMINNNVCPIENPLQLPPVLPQSPPRPNSPMPPQPSPQQRPSQSPATAATPASPQQSPVFLPDREMVDMSMEESFDADPIDPEEEQMKDELMNTIEYVRTMKMEDRPCLIKLVQNKKFKTLRHSVDRCLHELFPGDLAITELNAVSFGAALYIQRIHAPWYDEKVT